jgi:anti-anti-sigma regulatory factor
MEELGLEIKVAHTGDLTELHLIGVISEATAEIVEHAFRNLRRRVRLRLKDVKRINSFGVGVLMRVLNATSREHQLEYAECADIVVDQFQMLDFARYGTMSSFYARFVCDRCHQDRQLLIDIKTQLKKSAQGEVEGPTHACACGGRQRCEDSLEFAAEHMGR